MLCPLCHPLPPQQPGPSVAGDGGPSPGLVLSALDTPGDQTLASSAPTAWAPSLAPAGLPTHSTRVTGGISPLKVGPGHPLHVGDHHAHEYFEGAGWQAAALCYVATRVAVTINQNF